MFSCKVNVCFVTMNLFCFVYCERHYSARLFWMKLKTISLSEISCYEVLCKYYYEREKIESYIYMYTIKFSTLACQVGRRKRTTSVTCIPRLSSELKLLNNVFSIMLLFQCIYVMYSMHTNRCDK